MAQNSISDELKFKNFLGGMPPDPPSMSCLRQLSCPWQLARSILRQLPDQSKIASDAPETA